MAVPINRRLFLASMGSAAVVAVVGGYAVYRATDDSSDGGGDRVDSSDDIVLDQPGAVQDPTIGTNAPVTGTRLPSVVLETNDGADIGTAELIGQPLVLNVWFSTCGPCKEELPRFAAVHAELGDRVRFVGINPFDTAATNASFARERGVTYELLRDVESRFVDAVGIAAFPVTLFVDRTGGIVRQTGALEEDALRTYTTELLA